MAELDATAYHPAAPEPGEAGLVDWLRLIRSRGVGPRTFFDLMARHGSAAEVLAALGSAEGYVPCPEPVARAELRAGRALGAVPVAYGTPAYPAMLAAIADPPPVLWAMGDLGLLARPAVAIVGARNASSLGTRVAARLAAGLAEAGYAVVSGLARGIDAAAHHAALGGGTIAVQAGGIEVVYPPEHADLAAAIARDGLRLAEQPPGLTPHAKHFPLRNRIISGMARAVVVVEAAAKSGSLITARDATEQGRDILAVPGHPFDARAWGSNMLIREGATLVRDVADILEALGPMTVPVRRARPAPRAPAPASAPRPIAALHGDRLAARILEQLGPSPIAEDQLIRDLALPASRVAPEILTLELDGRIRRQPGGLLARVM